jgi:hypothetical protein
MTSSDPAAFSLPQGAVHAVQFYDDEASLRRTVADFIEGGLDDGERVIVIATAMHRESFLRELEARDCRIGDRLMFADARVTLASISNGDAIDEARFRDVVGGVVASASADGSRVRLYGEMVELLWAIGQRDAALRLEELGNEVARPGSVSILCAYSMGRFARTADLDAICNRHDHVVLALERERIDLVAIVRRAVEAQRLTADAKRVRLLCDAPHEPVIIIGDARRLQEGIAILLSNAIASSAKLGAVSVSIEREATTARIRVLQAESVIFDVHLPLA